MTFLTKNPVTRLQLKQISIPEETETYYPIGHYDLTDKILNYGTAYLGEPQKEQYGLSMDGQRMFGAITFKSPLTLDSHEDTRTDILVGFRSSYDKRVPVGIVCGSSVLVCDNMCLSGDIKRVRKHTKHVNEALDQILKESFESTVSNHVLGTHFFKALREQCVSQDDGYRMLGLALGRDVIRSTHLNIAKREWDQPPEAFKTRDAWSLYNAMNEALKESQPNEIMDRHVALHGLFKESFPTASNYALHSTEKYFQSAEAAAANGKPFSNRFATLEV